MFKKCLKKLTHKMKNKLSLKEIMNNNSGFTLIELVIVITVLGVIVAAFLPRTGGNVEKTKQVMHENLTNTIVSAIAEYGTEHKLTANSGGKINEVASVSVSTGSDDTLLRPIDKDHPLITGGYLDKVPQNPWTSEKDFKDYKYVIDFKLTEKEVSNPDGSTGKFIKLIPVVKLAEITDVSNAKSINRLNYIAIIDGKTQTTKGKSSTETDKLLDHKLYGYNFANGKKVDSEGKDL